MANPNNLDALRYRSRGDFDHTITEEKEIKKIKEVHTKRVDTHSRPTSKIYKQTDSEKMRNLEKGEALLVDVGNNEFVRYLMEFNGNLEIKGGTLNQFDMEIHNVVSTFYDNGKTSFSPNVIAKHLKGGNSKNYRPYKTLIHDIENSLDKMQLILVDIDFTKQAKKWSNMQNLQSHKITKYMLNITKEQMVFNNNLVETSYTLMDIPPIYEYSSIIGQIHTISRDIASLPERVPMNKESININSFIQDRIANASSKSSKSSSTILWSTLYNRCSVDFYQENYLEKETHDLVLEQLIDNGYLENHDEINKIATLMKDENFSKYYDEIFTKKKKAVNKRIQRKRKKLKENVETILSDLVDKNYIKSFSFEGNTVTGKIKINL
ncbi:MULTISPECIES: hypothetical protein [unclassified Staphylococcus]|uniref:hypothetical protein n=1 Tax=unclassified Staphylococcus TaxID=91994 RepID=UPI001AEC63BA|nr:MULTISPECIES: hypothetical protein [unclassified Staphylococcus]